MRPARSSPACSPRSAWRSCKQQTRLREDAVIGLVFTSFFAAGLLMVSLNPTSVNVQSIVLGNILGISDEDALQVVIIAP